MREHHPGSRVVVVGGYGSVGRTVCVLLAERFPGRVFAAGRDLWKAEAFSRKTGGGVLPLRVDLTEPGVVARLLEGTEVVVACAETDTGFVEEVLRRGVHYVDISASDARLRELEGLDALAGRRGATAILSVGLSPGLTNLLARRCVDVRVDDVRNLDVFVLLGLGEAHGEAAVRWTVENLDRRFEVPGVPGTVESLGDTRRTLFPGGHGGRTAYRFDFADQHVLARTLGAEVASTRLCFDSAAMTRLLALLKRSGVLRVLRYRGAREVLVSVLGRLRFGSDAFAVKVEAEGSDGGGYSCSAWGRGERHATAVVTALVAGRLLDSPPPEHGVFHIEQLFDPLEVFAGAEGFGISFDLGPIPL